MASVHSESLSALEPGPAWEIARLFPDQGDLSESDYLLVTDHTNRMAEFTDRRIEVLPMPTLEHQEIVLFLISLLRAFINPAKLGRAIIAPYRVRIADGRFREPDVVFMLQANLSRLENRFARGADLVMEVVSEDEPKRDLVDKRADYAQAGIAEYWIVDPRNKTVTVLRLESGQYVTHSEAAVSGQVRSALLDGFTADVAAVFAAAGNV
jgi:Uma2 family endonuclease